MIYDRVLPKQNLFTGCQLSVLTFLCSAVIEVNFLFVGRWVWVAIVAEKRGVWGRFARIVLNHAVLWKAPKKMEQRPFRFWLDRKCLGQENKASGPNFCLTHNPGSAAVQNNAFWRLPPEDCVRDGLICGVGRENVLSPGNNSPDSTRDSELPVALWHLDGRHDSRSSCTPEIVHLCAVFGPNSWKGSFLVKIKSSQAQNHTLVFLCWSPDQNSGFAHKDWSLLKESCLMFGCTVLLLKLSHKYWHHWCGTILPVRAQEVLSIILMFVFRQTPDTRQNGFGWENWRVNHWLLVPVFWLKIYWVWNLRINAPHFHHVDLLPGNKIAQNLVPNDARQEMPPTEYCRNAVNNKGGRRIWNIVPLQHGIGRKNTDADSPLPEQTASPHSLYLCARRAGNGGHAVVVPEAPEVHLCGVPPDTRRGWRLGRQYSSQATSLSRQFLELFQTHPETQFQIGWRGKVKIWTAWSSPKDQCQLYAH